MVFGDAERFAVESEITLRTDKYVFGVIRFVIGGGSVGYFDEVCLLKSDAFTLSWSLPRLAPRPADTLAGENAASLLTLAVDGYTGEYDEQASNAQDYEEACCYVIAPNGGEAFDGMWVLFVQNTDFDRVIWSQQQRQGETNVPKGECYRAVQEFVEWANQLQPA